MAGLRGSPASNTISASVRITEKDFSFVEGEQNAHKAGLVGFASKGPINTPTLVQSRRQLNNYFGYPHPESGNPYLIYAAEQVLNFVNTLYIVRVGQTDQVSSERAVVASVDVPSAGGRIEILSATTGDYEFEVDSFFRWKLNGVLHSNTLVVLADTYTATELAAELNSQVDSAIDGIEFFVSSNKIGVRTTWAYGPEAEFEFISVQDAMYGSGSVTGWGSNMTAAVATGTLDRYPQAYQTAGEYDFSSLSDLNIQIVVDGTDNILIDNVVQLIDLENLEGDEYTIDEIVDEINSQSTDNGGTLPGGWIAVASGDNLSFRTTHTGRGAKLLIKASSTAEALFGLPTTTKSGTSPSGTTGTVGISTYGRVTGDANSTGDVTFTLTADSAGIDGNNTQVIVANNVREGSFSLKVFNNGVEVESFAGLVKDQSSRLYAPIYLEAASNWIRIDDNTDITALPLSGTYSLTGGTDGIPADPDDQDSLIIGSNAAYSGIYALSEPEQIDIDLIAIPGHSSTAVVTALLDMCQNLRADCLAIIDPPFGLTVDEVVDWQNGTHPLNSTRFDSDYGALYWPWVKIRDNFNRVDVWVPPSGAVMATIARSDDLGHPWDAPAGVTRGIVPGIDGVFSKPTLEQMDLMYGFRNAVNPIVQFAGTEGYVIWGQKTLQRRPTALDRISVRRLMIYLEKRLKLATRQLLFEPHTEQLRARFVRIAESILSEIQVAQGIEDFIVKCDEELNDADVRNRNELRARIGVIPVKAAEFAYLDFSIHKSGGFTENADTF